MNVLFRNLSTRQLVLAGLTVALLSTLIIGWLQWHALRDMTNGRTLGRQIRSVQIALGVFRYSLSDAESAQFRFILTQNRNDLALYNKLMDDATDQFAALRTLTAGNALQQKYLDEIAPLLSAKEQAADQSFDLEQKGNHAGAMQIISSDTSRQTMLQIEAAVENMQTVASQLILIRQNAFSHTLTLTVVLSVAGLIVNLICIAGVLVLMRRLQQVQSDVTLDALKQMISLEDGKLTIEDYLRRRSEALSTHGKAQIEAEKLISQLGRRKPGRRTERITLDTPPQ